MPLRWIAACVPALVLACASSGASKGGGSNANGAAHEAPPAAAPGASGEASSEAMGSSTGSPEHEPEVVHTGKALALSYDAASERYGHKGAKCANQDAPDAVIGKPDKQVEMQVGHDKVVTYGFRFKEGTLIIRCRNDHVEMSRTVK